MYGKVSDAAVSDVLLGKMPGCAVCKALLGNVLGAVWAALLNNTFLLVQHSPLASGAAGGLVPACKQFHGICVRQADENPQYKQSGELSSLTLAQQMWSGHVLLSSANVVAAAV